MSKEHKDVLFLLSSQDQAFDAASGESQRGRDGADGTQSTTPEQLKGAAQRGESLNETFPLFTDPLPRARLSTFTSQGTGPLRWDTENRRMTETQRLRSEGSWCSSSCCFQISPHKSSVHWGKKDRSAGSTQTGNV